MLKNLESLNKDSGYTSELFSPSADGSCVFSSTPTEIKENTISRTRNAKLKINSFSNNKATSRFESFGKNIAHPHQVDKKSSINDILLDSKTIALIALVSVFAVLIISYKVILVTMPYVSMEGFHDASIYTQEKISKLLDWAYQNRLSTILSPLLCGIAVSMFAVIIVYFDSANPGTCPPLPFRNNSTRDFSGKKRNTIDLNYLTALATGFVVSAIMWYEL